MGTEASEETHSTEEELRQSSRLNHSKQHLYLQGTGHHPEKPLDLASLSDFFFFLSFFFFLGPKLWHMEVPRLGLKSEQPQ